MHTYRYSRHSSHDAGSVDDHIAQWTAGGWTMHQMSTAVYGPGFNTVMTSFVWEWIPAGE